MLGMSNNYNKIKARCLEAIRNCPGILQSELFGMGIGYRSNISNGVFSLCFEGSVIRIRDAIMRSYRLYPKGKEPPCRERRDFRQSLFQRNNALFFNESAHQELNKGHGDKFYMAFDAAFGLFDLEILQLAKAVTENDKLW